MCSPLIKIPLCVQSPAPSSSSMQASLAANDNKNGIFPGDLEGRVQWMRGGNLCVRYISSWGFKERMVPNCSSLQSLGLKGPHYCLRNKMNKSIVPRAFMILHRFFYNQPPLCFHIPLNLHTPSQESLYLDSQERSLLDGMATHC